MKKVSFLFEKTNQIDQPSQADEKPKGKKHVLVGLAMMTQACNPRYSGGRGSRIELTPAQAKS
jgi:hypothetical protein